MSFSYEHIVARTEIETREKWYKWAEKIPYLSFPTDWEVKAIPPFGGAIVRYLIKTPKCDHVSVYLDCFDALGYVGEPYWEVFPVDGEVKRFLLAETDDLLKCIGRTRG